MVSMLRTFLVGFQQKNSGFYANLLILTSLNRIVANFIEISNVCLAQISCQNNVGITQYL